MYKAPNAILPITANADIIQTALVCAPASNSAVESIGKNSPPTKQLGPENLDVVFQVSDMNYSFRIRILNFFLEKKRRGEGDSNPRVLANMELAIPRPTRLGDPRSSFANLYL